MELFREILINIFKSEEVKITFPNVKLDITHLIELQCYNALEKIKIVLRNESLSDSECFTKIEEIICILEEIGSGGGNRHDFGSFQVVFLKRREGIFLIRQYIATLSLH